MKEEKEEVERKGSGEEGEGEEKGEIVEGVSEKRDAYGRESQPRESAKTTYNLRVAMIPHSFLVLELSQQQ